MKSPSLKDPRILQLVERGVSRVKWEWGDHYIKIGPYPQKEHSSIVWLAGGSQEVGQGTVYMTKYGAMLCPGDSIEFLANSLNLYLD